MKDKRLPLAAALFAVGMLAILGTPGAMAQTRPALVQDTDQAARAPFQVALHFDLYTVFDRIKVSIPSGYRLVVDYVTIGGVAKTSRDFTQPLLYLSSSIAGAAFENYLIAPQQAGSSQYYYRTEKPIIYADSLYVSPSYDGDSPSTMTLDVVLSGHLVKIS